MSQKRKAESVQAEEKTKMRCITSSMSRMSDIMYRLFKFQDGSEYLYYIPNTLYAHTQKT